MVNKPPGSANPVLLHYDRTGNPLRIDLGILQHLLRAGCGRGTRVWMCQGREQAAALRSERSELLRTA